ncbi:tRNA lysidine(34) synthetase TilS [bacterium]|nr:tRNA lysidine(34) synthetase TilS [bacterium]
MLKKIKDCLIKFNVSNKSLLVAFSGGYDSTVLLNILIKLREELNFKLSAIHLNHNWRGEESDLEQKFCEDFCLNNNIDFYTKKLEKGLTSNELDAREARYNFFKEIYFANNFDFLLTAHTKSDNAETIIFRLAKGVGINGLKGISENILLDEMNVLRPMMQISREEIENYIQQNSLNVNFDSSNLNKKYKRNKVRLDLVPHFKELNQNFEDNILNTSKIAQFYDESLNYFLQKEKIFKNDKIDYQKFISLPNETKNIVLYKFISKYSDEISFKQIKLLLNEIESEIPNSGKYFSLSDSEFILIKNDFIQYYKKENINLNDYKIIISEVKEQIKHFPNGTNNYIYANRDILKEPLQIRFRKDGDIFQPFGMHGTMKLKKFLNMKTVAKFDRDNLILLTNNDNEILWIYPLATSEKVRVKDSNIIRIELVKNE